MGAGSGAPRVGPNTTTAAAPDNSPEAAMGAGSGAPRVGSNTTIAPNSDAANAEMNGVPTAAVATPVTPQTPNNATALPPLAPAAGAEATKIARFKELLGKAKNSSVTLPAATKESIGYFLNKLRFIESRQLNEALTPEEQKEMDGLYAELGQQGSENNPELVAAINDYNSLTKSAPAAAPAFNAAKDSQKANVTALQTELRAIADAAQKVGATAEMQPLFDRLKKVQTDAAGAGEDVKSAVQAYITNVEAELKKAKTAAAPTASPQAF